ncbi:hypothetical protein VTI28DRAFT_6429 [Corynascus sepedonium]
MSSQPPYYGQQPPQGYGAPPPGAPPGGPAPSGYGPPPAGAPYQYPPPGQVPGQVPPQQQPYYGYQQPPPPGQPGQYPPSAPYGQQPPQNAAYGQPPPQGAPYGQQPPQGAPYGQQPPPPPGQYNAQQPYGAPPPAGYGAPPPHGYPPQGQQWQQQPYPPPGAPGYPGPPVPPTPASQGYDPAQKAWVQPVNTSSDAEALRRAMKGMGCDEKTLIRVLTSPQYANPWALQQLVQDYNSRFIRNLADDIKSETRGDVETALLSLIRGPLNQDVYLLDKALNRMGTDEDTLMDVLLGRSNADVRAIVAEYNRTTRRDLLTDIKEDVDDSLFRLCSMVLAATRAEDAAPVLAHDIDAKVTELQRATEGMIGANAIAVAQIFASSNAAQINAMTEAYQRKYHRSLESVIEKEFRGDMEDALLRMLMAAKNRPNADALRLREALVKRKDKLLVSRAVSLYWDSPRLSAAKDAYKKRYGSSLTSDVKEVFKGDFEAVVLALLRAR